MKMDDDALVQKSIRTKQIAIGGQVAPSARNGSSTEALRTRNESRVRRPAAPGRRRARTGGARTAAGRRRAAVDLSVAPRPRQSREPSPPAHAAPAPPLARHGRRAARRRLAPRRPGRLGCPGYLAAAGERRRHPSASPGPRCPSIVEESFENKFRITRSRHRCMFS